MSEQENAALLPTDCLYVRSRQASIMTQAEQVIVRSPIGRDLAITKYLPAIRKLFEASLTPRPLQELASLMNINSDVAESVVRLLVEREVLQPFTDCSLTSSRVVDVPFRRVGLGVCGSIGCIGTPGVLTTLKTLPQIDVEVILTAGAQRFLNPGTIEHLGFRVWRDMHAVRDGIHVPHAWLAEQCEILLIAPASANTIQRLASGACSDLLSLVVACCQRPVFVAPAMHPAMWKYGPIQKNIDILRQAGMFILEPVSGMSVSTSSMQVGACAVTSDNILDTLTWLARRTTLATGAVSLSASLAAQD